MTLIAAAHLRRGDEVSPESVVAVRPEWAQANRDTLPLVRQTMADYYINGDVRIAFECLPWGSRDAEDPGHLCVAALRIGPGTLVEVTRS